MDLNDLLVSYKQVKSSTIPTEPIQEKDMPYNRYQRLLDFINRTKQEEVSEEPSIHEEQNPIEYNYIYNPNKETSQEQPYSFTSVYDNSNKSQSSQKSTSNNFSQFKNYNTFKTQFQNYLNNRVDINEADKKILENILTPIAAMESGFTQNVKNPNSSATGYFQFVDNTRQNYSKVSRDEFINNPSKQFDAAISYYNDIWDMLKPYENKMKERGVTPLQAVYGMWWRPASMINYLKTGKDNYISQSDNLTLRDILNKAKKWNV